MAGSLDREKVVVLTWRVQGTTGWGLFGLHLALGLVRAGVRVGIGGEVDVGSLPAGLRWSAAQWGRRKGDGEADIVMVQGLSNNFEGPAEVETKGSVVKVGLAIFEDPVLDETAVARLRGFDRLIVPSVWCQRVLEARGLSSVVVHQGFDGTVWHPAPRRRTDDRFVIFSGGKLEFRKGQDILIEAFKRFLRTPEGKDAVLLTQWHNQWPATMEGIWSKGYVRGIPNETIHGMDLTGWTAANGVPEGSHLDLGLTSNAEAANAIREADVAVFPSRAEGATNMVLTECMALGLPCIVAQNTGQLDVPLLSSVPLPSQGPVEGPCRLYRGFDGWGESDPDEIVEALRTLRNDAPVAKAYGEVAAHSMQSWSWPATIPQWREVLGV